MVKYLLSIAILSLALSACGGSDDDDADGMAGATVTHVPNTPIASRTVGGIAVTVVAAGLSFEPHIVQIPADTWVTIALQNDDSVSHTLAVYRDADSDEPVERADTGSISPGENGGFVTRFEASGTAYFRCEIHPDQMQGELEIS